MVVICLCACLALSGVLAACQSLMSRRPAPAAGTPLRYVTEPDIRVRIRSGVQSAVIAGPRLVVVRSGGEGVNLLATPVTITSASAGVELKDATGRTTSFGPGARLEVASGAPRQPGEILTLSVDGAEFPGSLVIVPRPAPQAGFDVVNELPIEIYLPGVCAAELFARWPEETYRAQAVAARTYALHQRERSRQAGRWYDVESTAADQVYAGLTANQTAIGAVQGTRGLVVTYQGSLLRTYYSSTCGGRAAGAAETWPTGPGYEFNLAAPIQGRVRPIACEESPLFRWEAKRTADELGERLRAWGAKANSPARTIGTVASVRPAAANPRTGRPARFIIEDVNRRRVELSAEELRIASNTASTRRPTPERASLVRSGDVDVTVRGNSVTIQGRGFGHGVGLCQYCAKGMADRGHRFDAMLGWFYPGATVERAY